MYISVDKRRIMDVKHVKSINDIQHVYCKIEQKNKNDILSLLQ